MRTRETLRCALPICGLALLLFVFGVMPCSTAQGADNPASQVIVCYFHRTVRCPTCKMAGEYIEEAVRAGYGPQLSDGTLKLQMVDYQDPRNQRYAQAYKVNSPMLVILDVRDGKVAAWKPVPKVWSLLAKKPEFFRCVQLEIQAYRDAQRTAAW